MGSFFRGWPLWRSCNRNLRSRTQQDAEGLGEGLASEVESLKEDLSTLRQQLRSSLSAQQAAERDASALKVRSALCTQEESWLHVART